MRMASMFAVLIVVIGSASSVALENIIPLKLPEGFTEHLSTIEAMPERQVTLDPGEASQSLGFRLRLTVRGPISQEDILAVLRRVPLGEFVRTIRGAWTLEIDGDAQFALVTVKPKRE